MSAKACPCGKTTDLRPYGPGGAWTCFRCATGTPAANAATRARFITQLDAAERSAGAGGVAAFGDDAGPHVLIRGDRPADA